jgi:hypothetical protein
MSELLEAMVEWVRAGVPPALAPALPGSKA